MKRYWLLGLLGLIVVSGVALADMGMLPNGAMLMWARLFIHENNNPTPVQPSDPLKQYQYFNMAHCECSQDTLNETMPTGSGSDTGEPFFEGTFNAELHFTQGTAPFSLPVDFWVGTQCDNDLYRPMNCVLVDSVADISSLLTTGGFTQIPVKLFDLMATRDPAAANARLCDPVAGNGILWALARTQGTQMYDYSLTNTYPFDTWAPCAPTEFTVTGAENAIEIKWTPTTNNVSDIAYYQALCQTSTGDQAFPTPTDKPLYQTSFALCGFTEGATAAEPHPVELDSNGHGTANIDCTGTGSTTPTTDAGVDAAFALTGQAAPIDAPAVDAPDAPLPPDAPDDASTGVLLGSGFATLDPSFICGTAASATATSMRIQGLQNGTPYVVELLTIDKYQNARAVYFNTTITPHAVTDFWEDLHDKGSHVQGGFCLIAETYGDDNPLTNLLRRFRDDTLGGSRFGRWVTEAYYATLGKLGVYVHGHLSLRIVSSILLLPLVLIAVLWHFLTLPVLVLLVAAVLMRRRVLKMRVRIAQVSSAALVLLVATHAHAQSPYWEDQTHTQNTDETSLADQATDVNWHVGIAVGPYTPAIDSQSGVRNSAGQGPYAAMFGGSEIMPMLTVDRFLWKKLGQLGVGLSIAYLGKSAHAYKEGTDPNDPNRARSPGDTNKFRLIPLVASAIYRFSYLDDEYAIPVVPYARAGLGYYIWWIDAPSGDFAAVCNNGGMPPCSENKAVGASLGVVGTIGLAIRAERIDASAARSMHESGIEHAGFFAELSAGKVDGFGSQSKLSVGDTTWFAGVDFEF
jgi:hypothetical protein